MRPRAFGVGIKKLQKAFFGEIKHNRLAVILGQALALLLYDQRRMAYLAQYGDLFVRQLVLGSAHPLAPLDSEEFQIAV